MLHPKTLLLKNSFSYWNLFLNHLVSFQTKSSAYSNSLYSISLVNRQHTATHFTQSLLSVISIQKLTLHNLSCQSSAYSNSLYTISLVNHQHTTHITQYLLSIISIQQLTLHNLSCICQHTATHFTQSLLSVK